MTRGHNIYNVIERIFEPRCSHSWLKPETKIFLKLLRGHLRSEVIVVHHCRERPGHLKSSESIDLWSIRNLDAPGRKWPLCNFSHAVVSGHNELWLLLATKVSFCETTFHIDCAFDKEGCTYILCKLIHGANSASH